jgi:hypothetical protein
VKKVHLAVGISFSLFLTGAQADDLVSLDDPAPAPQISAKPAAQPAATPAPAAGLPSLDSLDDTTAAPAPANGAAPPGGGDAEVALDVGNEDSFNPYNFARTGAWGLLPIGALILVGLHLFRVPKRKSKRKIDQARRFFRGISGEGTNTGIQMPEKGEKK